MNIVLFEENEIGKPLPLSDSRSRHITSILKFGINDTFDAGIINGKRGKGSITDIKENKLYYTFKPFDSDKKSSDPVILVTSFARPPESKKILKNTATIGVKAICFVKTEKSERSYMESSLWKNQKYREYLVEGAVQAFETDIPEILFFKSLKECLEDDFLKAYTEKAALDNYEYTEKLSRMNFRKGYDRTAVIAVGGERGWSSSERNALRSSGYTLCSLGKRVLKTETACIAGITVIKTVKGIF